MGLFDHLFKSKSPPGEEKIVEPPPEGGAPAKSTDVPRPTPPPRADPSAFLHPKNYVPRGATGLTPAPRPPSSGISKPTEQRRPAAASGPAPAAEEIVLTLGDVLSRIPTPYLKQGTHDPKRELRFKINDLSSDIARGRAAVPLSRIAQLVPDIFVKEISKDEDTEIRLPLQKLVEQIGLLRSRPKAPGLGVEKVAARPTPALETTPGNRPVVDVDSRREFLRTAGTPNPVSIPTEPPLRSPVGPPQAPPVIVAEPALSAQRPFELKATAEPPSGPVVLGPASPPVGAAPTVELAPAAQPPPPVEPPPVVLEMVPPAVKAAPVPSPAPSTSPVIPIEMEVLPPLEPKIASEASKMPEKSIIAEVVVPAPEVAAPARPVSVPAPEPTVEPAATSAPAPVVSPVPPLPVVPPPAELSPAPAVITEAAASMTPVVPETAPAPTPEPVVAEAKPVEPPIPPEPPVVPAAPVVPVVPIALAVPTVPEAAPVASAATAPPAATAEPPPKPVEPVAPPPRVEPAQEAKKLAPIQSPDIETGEEKIHLSLAAILRHCPPEIIAGPMPQVDDSVKITLPFAPIDRQLIKGQVEISALRFLAAVPQVYLKYFVPKVGVKVPIPLEEIFQNLPSPKHELAPEPATPAPFVLAPAGTGTPVIPPPVVSQKAELPVAPVPAPVETVPAKTELAPPAEMVAAVLPSTPKSEAVLAEPSTPAPAAPPTPIAPPVAETPLAETPAAAPVTPSAEPGNVPPLPKAGTPEAPAASTAPAAPAEPSTPASSPIIPMTVEVAAALGAAAVVEHVAETPAATIPPRSPSEPPPLPVTATSTAATVPVEPAPVPAPSVELPEAPKATASEPSPAEETVSAPPPLPVAPSNVSAAPPEGEAPKLVLQPPVFRPFVVPPPPIFGFTPPPVAPPEPEPQHVEPPPLISSLAEPAAPAIHAEESAPTPVVGEAVPAPAITESATAEPSTTTPEIPAVEPTAEVRLPAEAGEAAVTEPATVPATVTAEDVKAVVEVPPPVEFEPSPELIAQALENEAPEMFVPFSTEPVPFADLAETLAHETTYAPELAEVVHVDLPGQEGEQRPAAVVEEEAPKAEEAVKSEGHAPSIPNLALIEEAAPAEHASMPGMEAAAIAAAGAIAAEAFAHKEHGAHAEAEQEPSAPEHQAAAHAPETTEPKAEEAKIFEPATHGAFGAEEQPTFPFIEPLPASTEAPAAAEQLAATPLEVAAAATPEAPAIPSAAEPAPPAAVPPPPPHPLFPVPKIPSEPASIEVLPPPSLPLRRFDQDAVQALFMTEETLDLPKISRLAASLPGVYACVIATRDQACTGGTLPDGFDLAALLGLAPRVGEAASRMPIGQLKHFTLYGDAYSVSFFERNGLSLCAVHRPRSFVPGVREKLVALADELSR